MNQEIFGRRRLVRVPQTRLLRLMFTSAIKQTYVIIPHCVGLPEDVAVVGMRCDPIRSSVLFEVCHESFPITPEGAEPAEIDVIWTMAELAVPEGQDSRERGR